MGPKLCRYVLVAVLSAVLLPAGHAQNAAPASASSISKISQSTLDLYEQPDLNAPHRSVAVPEGALGADWQVLGAHKQFYQIQAGSHGKGWARRSFITVVRGSGVTPTCVKAASGRTEPVATSAGMGSRC